MYLYHGGSHAIIPALNGFQKAKSIQCNLYPSDYE